MEDDHYRFAVHFTHRQFPRPRPALVIGKIRRIRKLPSKPFGNVEPGVGTVINRPGTLPMNWSTGWLTSLSALGLNR